MTSYKGCPVSPSGELTEEFYALLVNYLDVEDCLPEPRDWRGFAIKLFEGSLSKQQIDEFGRLSRCDAGGRCSPTHELLRKYMSENDSIDVAFLWHVLHNELGREDVAEELVRWHHNGKLLRDPDEPPYYDQIGMPPQSNPTSGCSCSQHYTDTQRHQPQPGDNQRSSPNGSNKDVCGQNRRGAPKDNIDGSGNRQPHCVGDRRSTSHTSEVVSQQCRQATSSRPCSDHNDVGGNQPVGDCLLGACGLDLVQRQGSRMSSGFPSSDLCLESEPRLSTEYNHGHEWASRHGGDSWHSDGHESHGSTLSSGMGSEGGASFPGPLVDFSTFALPPRASEGSSVVATVTTSNTEAVLASPRNAAPLKITHNHRVGISFHHLDLALAQRLERSLEKNGCHVTLLKGISVLKTRKMDAVVIVYTRHYKEELFRWTWLLGSSIRFVFHNLHSEYQKHTEKNQRAVFYPSFDVKGHRVPALFLHFPERLAAREVFNLLFVPKANGS